MAALDGIETTLRRWGIRVLTDNVVPGRPGPFSPTHVMAHHTASAPGSAGPSSRVVRDGRPTIPGPLCHLLVRRDLVVDVISRGKANHGGLGGPWQSIPKDSANRYAVGIEIEHAGTDKEPWRPEYMAFCRFVIAASLDHLRQPATHLLAHKEWTTRKIDPWRWDMPAERRAVARVLEAGPTRPETDLLEEIMKLDRNSADYKAFVADVAKAAAREVLDTPQPLMGYVDALYSDADHKMTLAQAAQHAAGQAYAANGTAGRALDAAVQARQAADAAVAAVAALRDLPAP